MKIKFSTPSEKFWTIITAIFYLATLLVTMEIEDEFSLLGASVLFALLNMILPYAVLILWFVTLFLDDKNNSALYENYFLISNIAVTITIGFILIVVQPYHWWIVYILLFITCGLVCRNTIQTMQEYKNDKMLYARQESNELQSAFNKSHEHCHLCGNKHQIKIIPKYINGNNIRLQVFYSQESTNIDNCSQKDILKAFLYEDIYWLEQKINEKK